MVLRPLQPSPSSSHSSSGCPPGPTHSPRSSQLLLSHYSPPFLLRPSPLLSLSSTPRGPDLYLSSLPSSPGQQICADRHALSILASWRTDWAAGLMLLQEITNEIVI